MQEHATTADLLEATATRLERDGWQQHEWGDKDGPCCLVGALRIEAFGDPLTVTVWDEQHAMTPRYLQYKAALVALNRHLWPDITEAQLNALDVLENRCIRENDAIDYNAKMACTLLRVVAAKERTAA